MSRAQGLKDPTSFSLLPSKKGIGAWGFHSGNTQGHPVFLFLLHAVTVQRGGAPPAAVRKPGLELLVSVVTHSVPSSVQRCPRVGLGQWAVSSVGTCEPTVTAMTYPAGAPARVTHEKA